MTKPNLFLVGAPKCATSAMATYLGQHPEIFIAPTKELHFFGSDLQIRSNLSRPQQVRGGRVEDYLAHFAAAHAEKIVGEASVMYLFSQQAAQEIHDFNPDASIIITLRNPVDAVYSWHGQMLYACEDDIEDFGEALAAEEDRKLGRRIPAETAYVDGLRYCDVFRYSSQVRRYFDVFGRDRVLVLLFDNFQQDTAGVYRSALRFLGVEEGFHPDFAIVNPGKQVRSRALYNFLAHPPRPLRSIASALANSRLAREAARQFLLFFNTTTQNRPPMDSDLRRSLVAEYETEIDQLSDLLQRDLSSWSEA